MYWAVLDFHVAWRLDGHTSSSRWTHEQSWWRTSHDSVLRASRLPLVSQAAKTAVLIVDYPNASRRFAATAFQDIPDPHLSSDSSNIHRFAFVGET
jgi:hypothetical protein